MNTPTYSKIADHEWPFPQPPLAQNGWLTVSDSPRHEMYFEVYGAPDGEPVFFVHGGPGGATSPMLARLFDPERYRIVLFDQRGCGHSRPSASDDDARPALADNTTPHLIADMVLLRRHLGITGKMHVFGGSWGSTLSLAYAIAHPDTVASLILRGIFLCRQKDLDYFYQGNAAHYARDPGDTSLPGAYLCYPDVWKAYVEQIPPDKRGDMVKAYAEIFATDPSTPTAAAEQTAAAVAWSVWEGATSFLSQDTSDLSKFADPDFAKAFARIENHYFMNGAFLGGSGEQNRGQDFILENAARIAHVPTWVVHGRYDQVCPLFQAEDLVRALQGAGATNVSLTRTAAGHSMLERDTHGELARIMREMPRS
ncbi:MAG: prolyl aminopeptidase [Myxococcales bacterium]|nr:prolyl aminopeptidase [Myxococcales bacterium]